MLDMDREQLTQLAAVLKASLIGGVSAAVGHLVEVVHKGVPLGWMTSISVVVAGAWLGWAMDGFLPATLDERGVYIGIVCVSARPIVLAVKEVGPDIGRSIVEKVKRMLGP